MELKYKPPMDWQALLGFLEPRAVRGVEKVLVEERVLRRSLRIGAWSGWVECRVDEGEGVIQIELGGEARWLGEREEVRARAGRVFDLEAPTEALERLFPGRGGVRVPGAWDEFEMGVRAILGQQVSVAAAHTLAGRLVEKWGERIETPWPEVERVFPSPHVLAERSVGELRGIGLTEKRAETLRRYAEWSCLPGQERAAVRSLPGIGPWTEAYMAMRSGRARDAFPAGDLGVQKALGVEDRGSLRAQREAESRSKVWQPLRAYAVMLLWSGWEPS